MANRKGLRNVEGIVISVKLFIFWEEKSKAFLVSCCYESFVISNSPLSEKEQLQTGELSIYK